MRPPPPSPAPGVSRTFVLGLFLLGTVGVLVELLLLGHTEDALQFVPFGTAALGLAGLAWQAWRPSAWSIRSFQAAMGLYLAAGVTGIGLHYRGNVEFELEMYPGLAGMALFREAMTGAFPALAPGAMILLGLLGLAWAHARPADRSVPPEARPPTPRSTP